MTTHVIRILMNVIFYRHFGSYMYESQVLFVIRIKNQWKYENSSTKQNNREAEINAKNFDFSFQVELRDWGQSVESVEMMASNIIRFNEIVIHFRRAKLICSSIVFESKLPTDTNSMFLIFHSNIHAIWVRSELMLRMTGE